MALVSISEATRLTGKSRRTIQRYVATGKLSMSHHDTLNDDKKELENQLLQQQVELLKQRLEDKEAHIESLKSAMLLIELKLSINNKEKSSWLDNVISKLWKR
ncbi:hypothetical protein J7S95_20055 [Providencia stuartii]|uniref:hypothetical protein n=1 Tax=Providencia TaxID=586 RepID=UPI001B5E8A63|nr:hypothetical protein [Providencia stuartii]MBQ0458976.1 hypothetical protein [Providencia stuartii]